MPGGRWREACCVRRGDRNRVLTQAGPISTGRVGAEPTIAVAPRRGRSENLRWAWGTSSSPESQSVRVRAKLLPRPRPQGPRRPRTRGLGGTRPDPRRDNTAGGQAARPTAIGVSSSSLRRTRVGRQPSSSRAADAHAGPWPRTPPSLAQECHGRVRHRQQPEIPELLDPGVGPGQGQAFGKLPKDHDRGCFLAPAVATSARATAPPAAPPALRSRHRV